MKTPAFCPSDFALERFLLRELPEEAGDVAAHVDTCATCRAKVAAKEADDAEFMRSPSAAQIRRALGPSDGAGAPARSVARRSAMAAIGVAAAVALGVGLTRRPPAPSPPSAVEANDVQAVLRVQREWMEAVRDKDAVALDRILADDYTYTDSRGRVSYKADSLRQARAAGGRMKAFQTSDEKAQVYGDTAIITGLLRVEGEARGEPYEAEVRFTDILARIDGQWRAVAAHASKSSGR